MELKLTKAGVLKWLLLGVATLLLQALARGLWQAWLAPALHYAARWALDLASLGFSGYKNSVYQSVATDNPAQTDIQILNWVLWIYFMLLFWWGARILEGNADLQRQSRQTLKELSGAPATADPEITIDKLRARVAVNLRSLRRTQVFDYAFVIFIGLFCVSSVLSYVRLSDVSLADAHYHYVLRAVSPYLAPGEHVLVESDFTQINNREDYVRLLSRLEAQCKAHARTVPKFDPW
jgi:hypothetical protein